MTTVTYEGRIRLGFLGAAAVALVVICTALVSGAVVESTSSLAFRDAGQLIAVERLRSAMEVEGRVARTVVLTGSAKSRTDLANASGAVDRDIGALRDSFSGAREAALLAKLEDAHDEYRRALAQTIEIRDDTPGVRAVYDEEVRPAKDRLDSVVSQLTELQESELDEATRLARESVSRSHWIVGSVAIAAAVLAGLLGLQLTRAVRALRRQRETLAEYAARVSEVNRDLDAFAGRIAHDLRNALAPIPVAAEMLRQSPSPERSGALAGRMQRALDRALAMIDALLLFSRSSAPAPGASASLRAAVEDSLEQLAGVRSSVDAEVETSVAEDSVACSRELLGVVLVNLVGNALKFMAGRDVRRVRLASQCAGQDCVISVSDTGPGIPRDALTRVFEPFYRAPGTKASGTGIGLATVRRIVEAHGGSIGVESTPGVGTEFRVRLPRADAPALAS